MFASWAECQQTNLGPLNLVCLCRIAGLPLAQYTLHTLPGQNITSTFMSFHFNSKTNLIFTTPLCIACWLIQVKPYSCSTATTWAECVWVPKTRKRCRPYLKPHEHLSHGWKPARSSLPLWSPSMHWAWFKWTNICKQKTNQNTSGIHFPEKWQMTTVTSK